MRGRRGGRINPAACGGGLFPNVGSALNRRADLFQKQGRGLYGLKEWAAEEKA